MESLNIKKWQRNKDIKFIFNILDEKNEETRFIGGCLRNLILKKETDDICEWRDCKTLYKKSGDIPDLQHVSRIDLKMSPDIFQNNLKDFLNNNHPEKILHVDMHDWKNKQTIIIQNNCFKSNNIQSINNIN